MTKLVAMRVSWLGNFDLGWVRLRERLTVVARPLQPLPEGGALVRTLRVRRGFTIIEVVVVIVLLGVAAGLVVPRIVGGEDRKVRAGAERVAELLSAIARRDAMMSQPMALLYDSERERLMAQVVLKGKDSFGETMSTWREDRLLPDADLRGLKLVSVQADGAELDASTLRVEFDQFSARPSLRVVVSDEKDRFVWSVELGSSVLQAEVVSGDGKDRAGDASVVDLDDTGLGETAW